MFGKQIAKEARRKGYVLTAVVRNSQKANELAGIAEHILIAGVTKPDKLLGI
jgi:putative NADH-flavin reductase